MRIAATDTRTWITRLGLAASALACALLVAPQSYAANGEVGTTTTTLGVERCSQPVSMGARPTATDCLFILKAAVGLQSCGCICDPSGDGSKTATDALICLNVAVGVDLPLMCPCGVTTTTLSTTTSSTTSTSTTTTTTSTTTTSTTSTTTTTMGGGPDPIAGRADYMERCAFCHRAGSDDPSGDFSDLAGDGNKLVMDLGGLDEFMDGLFMTQPEIDDMAAYLDGL